MRKITKANARKFVKEVKSILQEHNAESIGNIGTMDRFKFNTKVGDLLISLEQPEDLSYCYTIFARFEEPDKARQLYNCNPYTGKNNFHLSDMAECIESFKWFLNSLIEQHKEVIQMLALSGYKARNYQYAGRDTEVGAKVRSTIQSHLERIRANEIDVVFNCSATGSYVTFADNYRDWTGETAKALTELENMTNTKDFWEVLDAANL